MDRLEDANARVDVASLTRTDVRDGSVGHPSRLEPGGDRLDTRDISP
jgi:hypothetical protein